MNALTVAIWISSLSFLTYGVLCLGNLSMQEEFRRFGIEWLRKPTGFLEVFAGIGLLVGLKWRPALWISSIGLALMMLIGLAIRLRAGDSWTVCIPAFGFMALNAWIFAESRR